MIIADTIFNHHAGSWLSVLSAWQLMVKAYGTAITGNIKYLHLWLQTFYCLIHFKYCVSRTILLKAVTGYLSSSQTGYSEFPVCEGSEGKLFWVSASGKDRPLLIISFIFISKTNKQKAQSNLLGFFFLGCIVLVSCFPPFKFHAVSSHLFLSCVKINIWCVLIQILYGITQA